jgi:hypothetical protein
MRCDCFDVKNTVVLVREKDAKPILEAGLNSSDDDVVKNAARARENLLKLARFDFLE